MKAAARARKKKHRRPSRFFVAEISLFFLLLCNCVELKSWFAPERYVKALGEAITRKSYLLADFFDRGEQELSILVTNIAMLFLIAAILLLEVNHHNDNCNVKDD